MAGIIKILVGEITQAKTKGANFVKELVSKLSPESISKKKDCGEKK